MRIFVGLREIANVASTYAKGFKALGHETFCMIYEENPFYRDNRYDLIVQHQLPDHTGWLSRRVFEASWLAKLVRSYDLFVFLFGSSLLPRYLDFPILKHFGKKIICVFLGSDIRYGPAVEQEMRQLGLYEEMEPFIRYINEGKHDTYTVKKNEIRQAERYADLILSQPGYGQLQTRPYMRFNIPVDLCDFQFNIPDRKIPVVIHAPSNAAIKGTEYVLRAVDQLKREGVSFEFRLIDKMPHAQLLQIISDADIVVDELFGDTVGVLSTEAMVSGNVVLAHYPEEFAGVPSGCPVVNINIYTLADRLREVITNQNLRRRLATEGYDYVRRNNDHIKVAEQMMNWVNMLEVENFDYYPDFYKQFQP